MLRKLFLGPILGAVCLILGAANAWAVNCSPNPFTLAEGTTAFATQVMANFNNLLTCANTILGTFSGPGSSVSGNAVTFNGTDGKTGQDSGVALNNLAWISYNPSVTCGTGTLGSQSPIGAYKTIGKTVFFTVALAIGTNGTCAGNLQITLPTAAGATYTWAVAGHNQTTTVTGSCRIGATGGFMLCFKYDGTYPGGDSQTLVYTVVYASG